MHDFEEIKNRIMNLAAIILNSEKRSPFALQEKLALSTLNIRSGYLSSVRRGTGLLVNFKDEYFVFTARHIVDQMLSGENLGINYNGCTFYVKVEEIYHLDGGLDGTVLHLNREEFEIINLGLIISERELALNGSYSSHEDIGQELGILGFPADISLDVEFQEGKKMPVPILKTGRMSSLIKFKGVFYKIIDCFGTPGFSGGPVFKIVRNRINESPDVRIFGIVVGGLYDYASKSNESKYVPQSGLTRYIGIDKFMAKISNIKLNDKFDK